MGLFDGTPLERPVVCERCDRLVAQCDCTGDSTGFPVDPPAEQQRLRIRLEKRKRGKLVTVVIGLVGSPARRGELLKELKQHCGAGGSLGSQQLEIQGDHVARVARYLRERGYRIV